MALRQVFAVAGLTTCLFAPITRSMSGVVASPSRTSPSAGSTWLRSWRSCISNVAGFLWLETEGFRFAGIGLSTAGGYLLQFALLERGDAGVVSSYIFAVPVLTSVYGVVLLGEPLSVGLVAGAAAVAAGILLVTVPSRPRVLDEPT